MALISSSAAVKTQIDGQLNDHIHLASSSLEAAKDTKKCISGNTGHLKSSEPQSRDPRKTVPLSRPQIQHSGILRKSPLATDNRLLRDSIASKQAGKFNMDRATPLIELEANVALPKEGENQVQQVSQKAFCTHQERTERAARERDLSMPNGPALCDACAVIFLWQSAVIEPLCFAFM